MQNRSMKQGLGKSVWWVRTILIEFLPDILPLSPPPSVSAWVERLFRPGKEREWRSEKDLFISSLCYYLHFLPPLPCTIPVLCLRSLLSLSPSFTPLSQPSSPSSPSLPPTPLLSLVLPCACPFAPLLKLSWCREVADLMEAFWLSSWYCCIMELVARCI